MSLATVAAASGEEIVPFDITRTEHSLFERLADARGPCGTEETNAEPL